MTQIVIPANGWRPRPYQMRAWSAMERGVKRHVLSWHRRAGKDDFALHRTAVGMMERVGNYWHMLPEASQARKAIWDAVNPHTGLRRIDEAFPRELRETTREQDMLIKLRNGATWQVVGSDNYNSLVGSPPIGVIFSEYALANPDAWGFLRPILAENGGWAMFISTVRGRNHFTRMLDYATQHPEDWFGETLTVEDTGAIAPEVIERERRELAAERGDKEAGAIIRQEYFCDADAAIPGAYYGELMAQAERNGRIGDFPWISSLPVYIATDLGRGDQCVNWFFQELPSGRIRIIDVLAGSGVGIDWYAQRVVSKPYTYRETIWPHDGGHGNIRDVSGTNLVTQAASFGWKPIRVIDRDQSVEVGIAAVRNIFGMLEFNSTPIPHLKGDGSMETQEDANSRMGRALDAIRQYRREYDQKRQCFRDNPLHDWTSDYADALRYLARGRRRSEAIRPAARPQFAILE